MFLFSWMSDPGKALSINHSQNVAELEADKHGNFLFHSENLQQSETKDHKYGTQVGES